MTWEAAALLALFMGVLLLTVKPMGVALAGVAEGRFKPRALARVDAALARIIGVRRDAEMDWHRYALAVILFNALGFLVPTRVVLQHRGQLRHEHQLAGLRR
jgi:K+-transporting ATPase ATPase A chain